MEYISKSFSVWFMGFFPLSEIIIAVPAGVALGLGYFSVILWAVFGNFVPVLLLNFGYDQLERYDRVRGWLRRFTSDKLRGWVNRWGVWAVLIGTPWVGVWVMTVTARAMGMQPARLLAAAFVSIISYALIISALLATGSSLLAP